jgi:steroid delta-isomerase-like uncharacterized protein
MAIDDKFIRNVVEIYNNHRVDDFDSILSKDCVLVRNGIEADGAEAIKRVLAKLYRAFPDIHYRIDDFFIAGNKVSMRWYGHGTHAGEYLGFGPSGREVGYDGITIYEMTDDGKIARIWVSADMLGLVRQLGAPGKQPEAQP